MERAKLPREGEGLPCRETRVNRRKRISGGKVNRSVIGFRYGVAEYKGGMTPLYVLTMVAATRTHRGREKEKWVRAVIFDGISF